MLDTVRPVETPEGIEIELRLAGPVVRALAWLLDLAVRAGLYAAGSMLLGLFGGAATGPMLIWLFALSWLYPVAFEMFGRRASPGKRAFKIRVLHDDGTEIGWSASLVRNILRAVDALPIGYAFGLTSTLVRSDFKRLGDIAAGTVVVHVATPAARPDLAREAVEPVPITLPLTLGERRAILDFADRLPWLGRARGEEVAGILAPWAGTDSGASVGRLRGMAAWLRSRS